MAEDNRVSIRQGRAIAALLTARSLPEAAKLAKVGERTLYRWLDSPDFKQRLKDAEGQAMENASRRLLAGQETALDTLFELMTSAKAENVRRLAASDWLALRAKWRELDEIEARLQALELAVGRR